MRLRLFSGLLILALSMPALATHETNEPSDGTVRSFRPVSPALQVPPIAFKDRESNSVTFETFKGKVVLLNIWATWCGPCIRELPALDRLQKRFADKEFVVLPISIDEGGLAVVKPFYQSLNLVNLGMYNDHRKALGRFFPLDVVPANFIVDRKGRAVSFLRSYVNWDDPEVDDMVNFYLDHKGPEAKAWVSPHPPRY